MPRSPRGHSVRASTNGDDFLEEVGAGSLDVDSLKPLFSHRPRGLRDQDAARPPQRSAEGARYGHRSRRTSTSARAGAGGQGSRSSEHSRPDTHGGPYAATKGEQPRLRTANGGFAVDRFGRRIPKMNPTPLENARKFKELCDGWNDSTAAGRVPTRAEFTRGVGWDVRLVSGVEAEEAAAAAASASGRDGGGGDFGAFHRVQVDDGGYSFLRTDCRAGWRKTTRGEGRHRPKLDMVFGDDFAELVGAGATRVGWMNGALADPGDGGHKPGEVNVNKALGHSVWTPHQDHLAAARRVEAAKYSAASMGRDAVIARREASARSQKAAAKKLAESAAEEEAILRARRQNEPPNHGEEMLKRLAKIRERTGNINFNVAVRERSMQDAKVKKSNAVRMMRSDIKMMEDIRVRQTARLKAIEKARLEELEHEAKVGAIIRMQRIFRHYLPVRLARLKRELEAEKARVAQTGGAPKKVHETLGPKVRLTYAQEKMSLNK